MDERRVAGYGGAAGEDEAAPRPQWSAEGVRRLRAHLGLSQSALAERIGTRQQTISEWETGARAPRRMSRRLLGMVAEVSGFYMTGRDDGGATEDGSR